MAVTRVVATPHEQRAIAAVDAGARGIALYHAGGPQLAGLGHHLPAQAQWFPRPPSQRAWDLLSIALAVYGSDRFVPRGLTEDGWTRVISLEVELFEPAPWITQASQLAAALRFLTGDIWHVSFRGEGTAHPDFAAKLSDRDCACLFSGGMDSFIGSADLISAGRRPLLVSQASPKEGIVQKYLADRLGAANYRFEGRAIERAPWPYEPSTRARSILFIAYGIMAATTLSPGNHPRQLFIPENGLISINPPLTRRRIGSLSTRTTHPHFISALQAILDAVGMNVHLVTPYRGKTKGEMLAECQSAAARGVVATSYSCGKGKRINKHCGRCLPCLVRRASFRHAGIADSTVYKYVDLRQQAVFDDVFSARMATAQLANRDIARWASEAGPLPLDPAERALCIDVVRRGLSELAGFLDTFAWP